MIGGGRLADLGEDNDVGGPDLGLPEVVGNIMRLGIHHRHHDVEPHGLLQDGIMQRLDDPARVGHAACLDHDGIDWPAGRQHPCKGAQQIALQRAADASVLQCKDRKAGGGEDRLVDGDGAEIIDDDSQGQLHVTAQHGIDQARLSGSERARDHDNGNRTRGTVLTHAPALGHAAHTPAGRARRAGRPE